MRRRDSEEELLRFRLRYWNNVSKAFFLYALYCRVITFLRVIYMYIMALPMARDFRKFTCLTLLHISPTRWLYNRVCRMRKYVCVCVCVCAFMHASEYILAPSKRITQESVAI